MSKTLIIHTFNKYRTWLVKDEADAKYRVRRLYAKEGLRADRAWLVDEAQELPAGDWLMEYDAEQANYQVEEKFAAEKAEYERLKKKFEAKQ